jgi:hypothetical protein
MPTAFTFSPVLPRVRYSRTGFFSALANGRPLQKWLDSTPKKAEDMFLMNVLLPIFCESIESSKSLQNFLNYIPPKRFINPFTLKKTQGHLPMISLYSLGHVPNLYFLFYCYERVLIIESMK